MQLVILAGGKGTRLGLTDIPKPMVEMSGKPLLEHQVELARRYGIDEIFILSGHLSHVIRDYFGDGSRWGVTIHHVVEEYPLGTAGAVKMLEGRLHGRFLVFYGDVVMDFDIDAFARFDRQEDSIATLLVHPNDHPYDSDLIEVNRHQSVTHFLSKPHAEGLIYSNLVNAAVYILSPEVLDFIPPDAFSDFGKHIFPGMLEHGKRIRAYNTPEYIKDMGTRERFRHICRDLESGKVARLNKRNKRPAVFLDRDGVLNPDMDTHPTVEGFSLLPGVAEAIALINNSDFLSIVVTNQPMVAKGFISMQDVDNVHKKLETLLGHERAFLHGLYYCPHHPEKGFVGEVPELKVQCDCRKPKTGMLDQAAQDFNIDMQRSWMIGDRESDMVAGKNAGCRTILVGETIASSLHADYRCRDLLTAVNLIMEQSV